MTKNQVKPFTNGSANEAVIFRLYRKLWPSLRYLKSGFVSVEFIKTSLNPKRDTGNIHELNSFYTVHSATCIDNKNRPITSISSILIGFKKSYQTKTIEILIEKDRTMQIKPQPRERHTLTCTNAQYYLGGTFIYAVVLVTLAQLFISVL